MRVLRCFADLDLATTVENKIDEKGRRLKYVRTIIVHFVAATQ